MPTRQTGDILTLLGSHSLWVPWDTGKLHAVQYDPIIHCKLTLRPVHLDRVRVNKEMLTQCS